MSGEWGIGHERAPPSRTYPGRIRGARASSHDAACARPPSDPRTRALVTSDDSRSRTRILLPKRRPSQSEQKEGHVASPFHRGTRSFRPRRDGHPDRQEDRRRGRRQQRRLLRPRRRRRRARRGPPHLFRGRSSPVRAPGADQSLPQRDRPRAPPGLPPPSAAAASDRTRSGTTPTASRSTSAPAWSHGTRPPRRSPPTNPRPSATRNSSSRSDAPRSSSRRPWAATSRAYTTSATTPTPSPSTTPWPAPKHPWSSEAVSFSLFSYGKLD